MTPSFWQDRRVLITGHTGFKGSWLSLLLTHFGARVCGYALPPPSRPNMYETARVAEMVQSCEADIRDLPALRAVVMEQRPEVIFHLAAQPIVRHSYLDPVGTFATNVMGTVNLLEAVRETPSVRALVVVTSDKCYENREWLWGYRESEALGGRDPYSGSKACAEIVAAAYRQSYFSGEDGAPATAVATVRAGNVIGGGDWAPDRIVPDAMRAFAEGQLLPVRAPLAVRPWQHVLEPLSGYVELAERLHGDGAPFAGAWNFGPMEGDARPVAHIVERLAGLWGDGARWEPRPLRLPHEATYLRLDCTKARSLLGWAPRLRLPQTLEWLVEWYQAHHAGLDLGKLTAEQIRRYVALPLLD